MSIAYLVVETATGERVRARYCPPKERYRCDAVEFYDLAGTLLGAAPAETVRSAQGSFAPRETGRCVFDAAACATLRDWLERVRSRHAPAVSFEQISLKRVAP